MLTIFTHPLRAAIATLLFALVPLWPSHAQEFIKLSDTYTCARFASGTSVILLNGSMEGQYSIIGAGLALKQIRTERRTLNEKLSRLRDVRNAIERGEFTKQAEGWFQRFLDYYLPSEQVKKKKRERLAQLKNVVAKVNADISLLKSIDLAVAQCADPRETDRSTAKYGQRIPVVVRPVIVPASSSYDYREAYVGMLISVPKDVVINDDRGRKIGTRSGYLACAKNLSTGKTFYRIFDDQPCQEAEGGTSGGNTSLPFADLAAYKALVPTGSWGSFGYWQALSGYPTAEQINDAYATLLATVQPFFQVVFYDADPYGGGVSLMNLRVGVVQGRLFSGTRSLKWLRRLFFDNRVKKFNNELGE